jgi:acyl-CoA thioester hydrolase
MAAGQTDGEYDMPELILTYRGVVYPWECDHMGHMNVMWYVGKFDEATWQLLGTLGLTPAYLRAQNRAAVAADQHITYKRELVAGDTVSVWSGVLEMRSKSIRFYHQMRNDVTGDVAAATILIGVHLDAGTRKPCPFPDEMAERGRQIMLDQEPEM